MPPIPPPPPPPLSIIVTADDFQQSRRNLEAIFGGNHQSNSNNNTVTQGRTLQIQPPVQTQRQVHVQSPNVIPQQQHASMKQEFQPHEPPMQYSHVIQHQQQMPQSSLIMQPPNFTFNQQPDSSMSIPPPPPYQPASLQVSNGNPNTSSNANTSSNSNSTSSSTGNRQVIVKMADRRFTPFHFFLLLLLLYCGALLTILCLKIDIYDWIAK